MNYFKAGVASALLATAACMATPAVADGLDRPRYGSIKDGPMYMPVRSAGPCYFRGDVGYSWSQTPDVRWFVNGDDVVNNVSMENTWLIEGGIGCGSGSHGLRGELVLGYRGKRDIDGEPGFWNPPPGNPPVDPLHTSITTYTGMVNVYYDLGRFGNFVPYVGAGMGAAYHTMDSVYFTQNPALVNVIHGKSDLAFAWSLMAGVGYQISERAVIDFGYRYIDLGKATSERVDSAGFVNPRVYVRDMDAHEFKIGLRYYFGGID
jgi:opacity protein-like surface antigen